MSTTFRDQLPGVIDKIPLCDSVFRAFKSHRLKTR